MKHGLVVQSNGILIKYEEDAFQKNVDKLEYCIEYVLKFMRFHGIAEFAAEDIEIMLCAQFGCKVGWNVLYWTFSHHNLGIELW